jgi:hypothetical protein
MASNLKAPTAPDADSGTFRPIVLTQANTVVNAKYDNMTAADSVTLHFGSTNIGPVSGNATGTVSFNVPLAEMLKVQGTTVNCTYTVVYPGGPATSPSRAFTVPSQQVSIVITQVLDDKGQLIPDGGTTTSTSVIVNGTVTVGKVA